MSLQPFDWNVVLIGRWNPAILSPAGIVAHVFGLPPLTQIQVLVPLDGISGYRVRNPEETLVVHVEDERLYVDILKPTYETLRKGMEAGIRVLNELPITPISAVGFNLNFKTSEALTELITATDAAIDQALGDQSYKIIGRSVSRSLFFGEGQINLTVLRKEDEFHVKCNFHLETTDVKKAKEWLAKTPKSIKSEIEKIMTVLNVQIEENKND